MIYGLNIQTHVVFMPADSEHVKSMLSYGWSVDGEYFKKTMKETIIVTVLVRVVQSSGVKETAE
jgi:hypothetical protein